MSFHNPSKDWDKKEKKMDEADMATADDDKEKVDVVTEEHEHDIPASGLFCTICRDMATFIFEGDSLCWQHYDEKLKEILNEHKKK